MRLTLCPLVLALLAAAPAGGVTAHLVKDINTNRVSAGSGPAGYVAVGGLAYFSADDSLTGRELWRTDGTATGTFEVVDACPGACAGSPRSVATNGRSYFFLASSGSGEDLWVTGGSPASTVRLTQGLSFPGATEGIWNVWVEGQGLLYFTAGDGAHGRELWRTDGTPAGTFQVADVRPGPAGSDPGDLTIFNGRLYFRADDGRQGPSLWTSDGTAGGTRLVSDPVPGSAKHPGPVYLRAVGPTLFFVAPVGRLGFELWKSDGTAHGTVPLTNLRFSPDNPFLDVTSLGNRLLFLASDPKRGQELWASDGTPGGTRPLTNLPRPDAFFSPGSSDKLSLPREPLGGRLLFRADDGPHGRELWTTDGTPQGTHLLQDLCPGSCDGAFSDVAVTGGRAFFTGNDVAHGPGPWVTDGTPAGTRLIGDFCAGSSSCVRVPYGWHAGSGKVFFGSQDAEAPYVPQLWATDGTAAGTLRLTSFSQAGLTLRDFQGVFLHGTLLFGAYEVGLRGQEPWTSDGTLQGTRLLKDIDLEDFGGSAPYDLHAAGGKVYFLADEGNGYGVWVSDGTEAGTAPVLDGLPPPLPGATVPQILAAADVGGRLFFSSLFAPDRDGNGDTALWRTDGTPAGTVRLTPEAVQVSPANDVVALGGQAFFIASGGAQGYGLWVSDGTAAGTRPVAGPPADSPFFDQWHLTAFQERVFFVVPLPDASGELWRSDGTATGTVPVKALASEQRDLVEHAGRLWFVLHPFDDSGSQIWSSDGTAVGTAPASFYTATTGSGVWQLVPAGSRLFFWVSSHTSSSLWVSDGFSAGGTREVAGADVAILFNDFDHSVTPAFANGQLLFSTSDGGGTLWKSDGSAAGTGPLLDRDGHTILDPYYFRPFASQIFFTTRGEGGLYQTDGTQAGTFKVLDLREPFFDTSVFELAPAGPRLFFRKWDRDHGSELWALESE
ncbi:MAG TPA: ELWxxDGT repeat protein [Thermoanaerobaculia bacterium]|jgi:ELWxxDGT repeat protein